MLHPTVQEIVNKFEEIAGCLGQIPEDLLDAIARETEHLSPPLSDSQRKTLVELVPKHFQKQLVTVLQNWRPGNGPKTGKDFSLLVRSVGIAHRSALDGEKIELAWTGPDDHRSTFRRTDQSWIDVIRRAQASLWIMTYVAYPDDKINRELENALSRSVEINIVTERPDDNPRLSSNGFNRFTDLLKEEIRFWAWPLQKRQNEGSAGMVSMHAKCAVADRKSLFLSSANLTAAAYERNLELGMILEGGHQPGRLVERLESMVKSKELIQFSPS